MRDALQESALGREVKKKNPNALAESLEQKTDFS